MKPEDYYGITPDDMAAMIKQMHESYVSASNGITQLADALKSISPGMIPDDEYLRAEYEEYELLMWMEEDGHDHTFPLEPEGFDDEWDAYFTIMKEMAGRDELPPF